MKFEISDKCLIETLNALYFNTWGTYRSQQVSQRNKINIIKNLLLQTNLSEDFILDNDIEIPAAVYVAIRDRYSYTAISKSPSFEAYEYFYFLYCEENNTAKDMLEMIHIINNVGLEIYQVKKFLSENITKPIITDMLKNIIKLYEI